MINMEEILEGYVTINYFNDFVQSSKENDRAYKVLIYPKTVMFNSIINVEIEYYKQEEYCAYHGIPARDGSWHQHPVFKHRYCSKPAFKQIVSIEDFVRAFKNIELVNIY